MKTKSDQLLYTIGIIITLLLVYLSLRHIELSKVMAELKDSRYGYVIPAMIIMFMGHWFRTIRWKYLLKPCKEIDSYKLFSALMIGYLGNTVLPAHMGEIVRSYVLKKNESLSGSFILGTIVLERLIDVVSLLVIVFIAIFFSPIPGWLLNSMIVMASILIMICIVFILLRKFNVDPFHIIYKLIGYISKNAAEKFKYVFQNLLDGIIILKQIKRPDYLIGLTILIWFSYWMYLHLNFYAFDMVQDYNLKPIASLIVLLATTFSLTIPSSPGYVGTYHYLCLISLLLFNVPEETALSYAIISHAANIGPLAIAGLFFSWKEGVQIFKGSRLTG